MHPGVVHTAIIGDAHIVLNQPSLPPAANGVDDGTGQPREGVVMAIRFTRMHTTDATWEEARGDARHALPRLIEPQSHDLFCFILQTIKVKHEF